MKSLKKHPYVYEFPKIFTEEIIAFINSEGFEWKENDSYCNGYNANSEETFQSYCFRKDIENHNITVYIFSNGVGFDKYTDSGGDLDNQLFLFEKNNFEFTYGCLVDYVNKQRLI